MMSWNPTTLGDRLPCMMSWNRSRSTASCGLADFRMMSWNPKHDELEPHFVMSWNPKL